MRNMLLRPTSDELEAYGDPDFVIFNSGACSSWNPPLLCSLCVHRLILAVLQASSLRIATRAT